jgi:hypothetical protein
MDFGILSKRKILGIENDLNNNATQQWRASTAPQGPAHWPKLRMLAGPLWLMQLIQTD